MRENLGRVGGRHPNDQRELVRGWKEGAPIARGNWQRAGCGEVESLKHGKKRRRAVKVVMVRKKQRGGTERSGSAGTDGEGVTPEQG